ncbi:MAG: GGDEF domain-containing protein [Pseudomonadota bacterium]
MTSKRKLTLGLQIVNLYGDYAALLWPGIQAAARERDANVIIFPGRLPNYPSSYSFEYQGSSIYEFINGSNIDALVVATGTFANFLSPDELTAMVTQQSSVPTVSISIAFPGIPSIVIDNKTGLREAILHLIRYHGCKNIAFVGGPRTNNDAVEREQVFRDALTEAELVSDERCYFEGDFLIGSGVAAVHEIFVRHQLLPDAVVCANDNMAIGVVRALRALNIAVPGQVRVTGFDNAVEGSMIEPPLTTIDQPIFEQARVAALTALDMVAAADGGQPVPMRQVLPTRLIIRNSCGCLSHDVLNENDLDVPLSGRTVPVTAGLANEIAKEVINLAQAKNFVPGDAQLEQQTLQEILGVYFPVYLGKSAEGEILERLEILLAVNLQRGLSIDHWQILLSMTSITMRKMLFDHAMLKDVALFLEKTHTVIFHMLKKRQNSEQLLLRKRLNDIREFVSSISGSITIDVLIEQVKINLPHIGINTCYICAYEKPVTYLRLEKWQAPEKVKVLLWLQDAKDFTAAQNQQLGLQAALPQELSHCTSQKSLVLTSLYFREEQLGYMVMEVSDTSQEIYDLISSQVSSLLKTSLIFQAREEAEEKLRLTLFELKSFNLQLKTIAEKDELTGLYNRRGFMDIASQSLNLTIKMKKPAMVFFADIDGLKQINDVYGHETGDVAIKAASEALIKAFRTMDILARLGGDEFTIFTADTPESFSSIAIARLDKNVADYNRQHNHPWQLAISIGWDSLARGQSRKLSEIMKAADAKLYAIKRARKRATRIAEEDE